MTACKEAQGATPGKKAVGATLAGVLAVGMVPAAAFAAEAPADGAQDDGIDLLFNESAAEAFSNGEAQDVYTYDNGVSGRVYTSNDAGMGAAKGISKMVVPTTIKVPSVADPVVIATSGAASGQPLVVNPDFKVSVYAADKDGNPTGEPLSETINPGKYVTVVEAIDGDYKGGKVNVPFTINAADLGTLGVYEVNPSDAEDDADVYLEYTGAALDLGITGNGAILEEGVDYSVKYFKAATNTETEVTAAGTYYAEVTGLGIYAGKTGTTASFEVNKFDLTTATITGDDVVASNTVPTNPTRVESAHGTVLDPSLVTIKLKAGQVFKDADAYTFEAYADDSANIISKKGADVKNLSINKIEKAATFQYDGDAWVDSFTTDLSAKKPTVFDTSKVEVLDGETALSEGTAAKNYTVTVYDAKGQVVTDSDAFDGTQLTKPGTYTVKVSVNTGVGNYEVGGSATATVKVTKGAIDADATAWVSYQGKVIEDNALDKAYDPTKAGYAVNDFAYGVKDANGKDVAAADYTVKITDQDGKEYKAGDVMKDAGTYTFTITSTAYDITNATAATFTILPLDLSDLKLGATEKFGSFEYVPTKAEPYEIHGTAGSSWSLDPQYNTGKKAAAADAANDGKGFDAIPTVNELKVTLEQYDAKADAWKTVTKVSGEGSCRVTVAPLNSTVAKNYKFAADEGTVIDFQMVDPGKLNFYDVLPTEGSWYFDTVDQAKDAGYINGYAGTKLFGPNDQITRGQVACVLFNLAGGESATAGDLDGLYNDLIGWKSFDDVNGKAYYGQAIAWAKQAGVVNGYGDGTFKADQEVTREEFAAMLANYAQKFGNYEDVDADAVLATFPDASGVSGWAKDAVAWAASQKVMGNGGFIAAGSDITRAEAASMVVNYAEL